MKKRILLTLISLLTTTVVDAQAPFIYGEIGGGGGSNTAIKFGVNSLFLRDHIISFNYYHHGGVADNIPEDYRTGLRFFDLFDDGRPRYNMNTLSLLYGKMFFSETPVVRFALKGGITIGGVVYPDGYIPKKSGGMFSFGTNYDVVYKDEFVSGILLNPVVELPFTSGWGMALGVHGSINSYKSFVNVEITTIFGKMRDRLKESDFEED